MTWLLSPDAHRGRRDQAIGLLLLFSFATLPMLEVRATKTVAISDLPLAAAAVLALVGGPLGRSPRELLSRPLLVGIGLMAAGGALGLIAADAPFDSAVLLGRLLGAATVSLVVISWWDPPAAAVRCLLGAFTVGAAVSAQLGVLGAGVPVSSTEPWRDGIERATGLTGNANHLGAISAIGFGLALGLCVTAPPRSAKARAGWLVAAAVLAGGVVWSGSRSGLIGVIGGGSVIVLYLLRQGRWRPVAAVAAAGAAIFLVAAIGIVRLPVVDRLLLRTDTVASTYAVESTDRRLDLARERLERAGPGSLLWGSGMENSLRAGGHSGYLEIWVGTGLLGITGWITVCAVTIAPVVRRAWRRRPLTGADAVVLAAGAGFLAHLASTLFLEHIWDRYIWLLVAVVAVIRHARSSSGTGDQAGPAGAGGDATTSAHPDPGPAP